MTSPTVEAWFRRRGMRLTPTGEVAVIAAAGVGMLTVTAVTLVAVVLLGGAVV